MALPAEQVELTLAEKMMPFIVTPCPKDPKKIN
jgi:hypothetical protein